MTGKFPALPGRASGLISTECPSREFPLSRGCSDFCMAWSGGVLNAPTRSAEKHIVVVGGGITGLAAAHRLLELDANFRVTLLESARRLGGVLNTERRDGF